MFDRCYAQTLIVIEGPVDCGTATLCNSFGANLGGPMVLADKREFINGRIDEVNDILIAHVEKCGTGALDTKGTAAKLHELMLLGEGGFYLPGSATSNICGDLPAVTNQGRTFTALVHEGRIAAIVDAVSLDRFRIVVWGLCGWSGHGRGQEHRRGKCDLGELHVDGRIELIEVEEL